MINFHRQTSKSGRSSLSVMKATGRFAVVATMALGAVGLGSGCSTSGKGSAGGYAFPVRHRPGQTVQADHRNRDQPRDVRESEVLASGTPTTDKQDAQRRRDQASQQNRDQTGDPLIVDAQTINDGAGPAAEVDPQRRSIPPEALFNQHAATRPDNADFRLYGHVQGVAADLSTLSDAASNLQQVTFTQEGADFDPEVDPSGRFLVYASTRHRSTSDIYVTLVGGTSVTQLTDDPANDMMPTFSPDGQLIAYSSDRTGNWDIYIVDTSGTQLARQITTGPGHDIHPSFSPDGKRLVYSSFSAQSGQWEMVVINLDGPSQPRFIGYGLNPVWSPVEDRILFQRARERGTRWFSIWTCDLTPESEAVAFTEIASSTNAAVITPAWSPDGRFITFATVLYTHDTNASAEAGASGGQPRHADIWVMSADGTGRTMLTGGEFANLQPTWSISGDVLFISDRGLKGVDNVWSVRPDSALRLARPPSSPDSRPNATASVPIEP